MALPNTSENPAWDPEEMKKESPIMGISLCELSDEFFKDIEDSYDKNPNTTILVNILSQAKIDLKKYIHR
ncbi:hypothetical protein CROQUDRAFT_102507 [Cronartium quercuum f. sp. fusiforme G11]|uniref:Uncharacterized protein n=1 Tax=Cronartium quercuum f. sp. fusiforme G11 TaxID=708437 RepID=A0A9P6N7U5_9BASI|nr:hypothetical protein CROQUDRAFT_102507 [Cronartium quercuum f. sp. fusiforme G11]